MLVELSTGVSAINRTLFVFLCQTYEQSSVVTSCIASTSSQNAVYRAFSFSALTPENILLHALAAMSGKDTLSWQRRIGFSIIKWPHLANFDDWSDFNDWDKTS